MLLDPVVFPVFIAIVATVLPLAFRQSLRRTHFAHPAIPDAHP